MARFFPKKIKEDTVGSEQRVWKALSRLDDSWIVFHSVTWQSLRAGRQGDGEADFVLLHAEFGMLVLEVKGGEIEVIDGDWYSVDKNRVRHRIKNPFDQAKASKYALITYLRSSKATFPNIPVGHAIAFPNISIDRGIGLYGPRDVIVDRQDLSDIGAAIERTIRHWNQPSVKLTHDEIERITALLAPTVSVKIRLRDVVAESHDLLIALTERQIQTFAQLRYVRRALVTGGAGTGKTVLAIERAKRFAAEGFKSLLTCYNAPLKDFLSAQLALFPNIRVATFHSLCIQEARRAGIQVPRDTSDQWWEWQAVEVLREAAIKNGAMFDAIVVDEGQDFAPEWFGALIGTLKSADDGPFYVFADSHQELYARNWSLPDTWPQFPLDINCRSTLPIAERVSSIYRDVAVTLGAQGPMPVFVSADLRVEGIDLVQSVVGRLIQEEGLSTNQIVVLSDSKALVEQLRETFVGEHSFTSIDGVGVVVESVNRFKGLEADAVVLALTDADMDDVSRLKSIAYVGMSRARVVLFVFGSEAIKRAIEWNS